MFQLKNIQICKSPSGDLEPVPASPDFISGSLFPGGLLLLLFLFCFGLINAQTILINGIPRDTSYTVYSSFIKERKNFPFIQMVDTRANDLNQYENIPYKSISATRKLALNIFRPKTSSLPVVLMIHSGGWNSGSPELQKALAVSLTERICNCHRRISPHTRSALSGRCGRFE